MKSEDIAKRKEVELIELAYENICIFNEDNYLQFEKSISLDKETYPEYDWIDGIQLVGNSIVVWLSTENSEDVFSLDIEEFDAETIGEIIDALKYTKNKLVVVS